MNHDLRDHEEKTPENGRVLFLRGVLRKNVTRHTQVQLVLTLQLSRADIRDEARPE